MAATVTQAAVSTGNIKPTDRRVEHNLVRDMLEKEIKIEAKDTAKGFTL